MNSSDHKNESANEISIDAVNIDKQDVEMLDAQGLQCPLPLLRTKQRLNQMNSGQRLLVLATDAGALRDIPAFCDLVGHRVLERAEVSGVYRFLLEKC